MAKFHKLKISDIRKETSDCVSIAFEIPQNLSKEYQYIQGQYLTLKVFKDNTEYRRSYSLCSSPISDSECRIAAKEVVGGAVSPWLNKTLKVGDEIEVMTPMGNFHTPIIPNQSKNYLLFAGGSGITPIYSIIKTVLHVESNSSITLFYANKNENSIIFDKAIKDLTEKHANRFKLYNILENGQNPQFTGILTHEKTIQLLQTYVEITKIDDIFICGPAPMMENIKTALLSQQVNENKIHIEYFTTVLNDLKKQNDVVISEAVTSSVTIVLDGDETMLSLNTNGISVLDAAQNAGVDVPFSCKGAVCCTCKAKVTEGKAKMDMNYALTDQEVEEGFILTCQAHPITEKLTVDYDQAF